MINFNMNQNQTKTLNIQPLDPDEQVGLIGAPPVASSGDETGFVVTSPSEDGLHDSITTQSKPGVFAGNVHGVTPESGGFDTPFTITVAAIDATHFGLTLT
jgi:methyl coenzyme M reductase beta subunit